MIWKVELVFDHGGTTSRFTSTFGREEHARATWLALTQPAVLLVFNQVRLVNPDGWVVGAM